MDAFAVFGIQTFLSFVVFGLLASWFVWPWLRSADRTTAFTALTFIHALRPIGATVLVASVAGTALPRDFAEAVAYGDLATSVSRSSRCSRFALGSGSRSRSSG